MSKKEKSPILHVCEDCGKEFENLPDNGDCLCADCFEDKYAECAKCGNLEERESLTKIVDGGYVCESCLEDFYKQCDSCGEYHHNWYMNEVINQNGYNVHVCDNCREESYYQCDNCGRYHHGTDVRTNRNDGCICDDCWNEHGYTECYECGDFITNWREIDDEPYCYECANSSNDGINSYDYKPNPIFYKNKDEETSMYFGIELEIDDGGESHRNAKQILSVADGHVYCKHDGSLDEGFEIVTHPASVNYHLNVLPWKKIVDEARSMNYHSHDCNTCGLHIHMSKEGFGSTYEESELNMAKLLLIFENNWLNLVKFSRRTNNELNRWACRYGKKNGEEPMRLLNRAKGAGKYFAVNLGNNDTVEIRIFKGTLILDTLYASIQLMDTIVKICKETELEKILLVDFNTIKEKAISLGYMELMSEIDKRCITVIPKREPQEILNDASLSFSEKISLLMDGGHEIKVRINKAGLVGLSARFNGQIGIVDSEEMVNGDRSYYRVVCIEDGNDKWSFFEDCLEIISVGGNV